MTARTTVLAVMTFLVPAVYGQNPVALPLQADPIPVSPPNVPPAPAPVTAADTLRRAIRECHDANKVHEAAKGTAQSETLKSYHRGAIAGLDQVIAEKKRERQGSELKLRQLPTPKP